MQSAQAVFFLIAEDAGLAPRLAIGWEQAAALAVLQALDAFSTVGIALQCAAFPGLAGAASKGAGVTGRLGGISAVGGLQAGDAIFRGSVAVGS